MSNKNTRAGGAMRARRELFATAAFLRFGTQATERSDLRQAFDARDAKTGVIGGSDLDAAELIERVATWAAKAAEHAGAEGSHFLGLEAAYGLFGVDSAEAGPGARREISLVADGARRLWAAGLAAALRAGGADQNWTIAIDGPLVVGAERDGETGLDVREAVFDALLRAFGAPQGRILVVARAPGDREPLLPRLSHALGNGCALGGVEVAPERRRSTDLVRASALWACRCSGAAPIVTAAPDGLMPLLPPIAPQELPGCLLYARRAVLREARLPR